MDIGRRLRELRKAQGFSQGDIEKRTGLLRACVSRVEGGHMIPLLVNLEKWANALALKLYQVFYHGKGKPLAPEVAEAAPLDARERKLHEVFRRAPEKDQSLFHA